MLQSHIWCFWLIITWRTIYFSSPTHWILMEHNKVPVKNLEYAKCATLSPRLHLRLIKFLASKAAHVFNSVRFEPSSHLHFHLCILALETPGPSILPLSGPQLCAGNCMYIYHDPRGIISVTWHLIQHLHLCRNCLSCSPYSRGPPSPVVPFSFIFLLLALPLFLSVSLTCRHQAGSTTRGMTHTCCPVFHPPQYLRPLLTTFDRSLSYLQLNLPTCVFFASPHLGKPRVYAFWALPPLQAPGRFIVYLPVCPFISAFCIYQFDSTVRYSQFVNVKYSYTPIGPSISLQIWQL